MMNCTDAREQLALRLYDEIDERESAALQTHLESCAACRSFTNDLGRGLGRLAANTPDDLPLGWADQLRGRMAEEPQPRVRRSAPVAGLAVGAGIAAGFLLGLASAGFLTPQFTRSAPDHSSVDPGSLIRAPTDFKRTTPAPLALAGGDLSRLQAYLRR